MPRWTRPDTDSGSEGYWTYNGDGGSQIRTTPEGDIYPHHEWSIVHTTIERKLGFTGLARKGILVEQVTVGETWPLYHRNLLAAADPVWTAPGFVFDAKELLGDQAELLEVVPVPPDATIFPGMPDSDGLDAAMASWAATHPHVVGAVRAYVQTSEQERVRAYGALIDDESVGEEVRSSCAETIRRHTGGRIALEVAVPSPSLPKHQRRLFDVGVALWEIADE